MGVILRNVKKIPVNHMQLAMLAAGGRESTSCGRHTCKGSAPEFASDALDDWPYSDHSEPAVLQAMFSTLHLLNRCRNATLTMAAEGSYSGSFTGGAAAAKTTASVPWEYCAGQVQCNYKRSATLEPAVQSRANIQCTERIPYAA
jgi:hypothetical protein